MRTPTQKLEMLAEARKKAVVWHNAEKAKRLLVAESEANELLKFLDPKDRNICTLAFALLYMGEGLKKKETAMGNGNPLVLQFFVTGLINLFGVERRRISCELHLRADQNEDEIKYYWSNQLDIPLNQFKKSSFDHRTLGKPTYTDYKGVCVVRCGNVAIQRKLVYLSKKFCEQYISSALSSVGRALS